MGSHMLYRLSITCFGIALSTRLTVTSAIEVFSRYQLGDTPACLFRRLTFYNDIWRNPDFSVLLSHHRKAHIAPKMGIVTAVVSSLREKSHLRSLKTLSQYFRAASIWPPTPNTLVWNI
ncbi:hypothetical protein J6590_014276 [Homalodisca vitripennis]|nr:hypothetical protein J6590_014276 [Homalodisca vitripennis]